MREMDPKTGRESRTPSLSPAAREPRGFGERSLWNAIFRMGLLLPQGASG